jgi:SAM-dependent methyltransferase
MYQIPYIILGNKYFRLSKASRSFPDWNTLYKNENVVNMPWYNENLDYDLNEELVKRNLFSNIQDYKFLDLGTGPGTQAIKLSELGFDVTASDLSEFAIEKAKRLSDNVTFIVDDILNSKFGKEEFDYIFDRGCFHVLPPNNRNGYVAKVKAILKRGGILFLKCFSEKESWKEGPYRFSSSKIKEIFGNDFEVLSIKETVYQGTLNPLPKALFVVMRKN